MSPPRLRTWAAYTSASWFFREKVNTGFPAAFAASSTRSAWSQSRLTQFTAPCWKMRSLEAK